MTRKDFLLLLGAVPAVSAAAQKRVNTPVAGSPRVLLVVAHPDDEYNFAAATYRIAKELSGVVDQVVVTNGEGGFRYSDLAERFYNEQLTDEALGRARLPEIRRRETLAAGRILGIRHHYFLNQKDSRYTLDPAEAFSTWNVEGVTREIVSLLTRERYDFVFTMLPAMDTHGHHQAATLIAQSAVSRVPAEFRPVVLAADPAVGAQPVREFAALPGHPGTQPLDGVPVFRFDRNAHFGFRQSLTYQVVVNWMIAEHKSQGLFQNECNRLDEERFWLFEQNPPDALARTEKLFNLLHPASHAAPQAAKAEPGLELAAA
jgi:LmbE family N-acetylglucosaminyl deacetylase